jgi:hypothetical protein
LAELWGKGVSASQISTLINQKFKSNYTRSAVIGKAHRMHLAPHNLSTMGKDRPGRQNRKINASLRRQVAQKPRTAPLVAFPALPLPEPTKMPERALWVSWEALEAGQCHMVWGDPLHDFGYCGKPVIPGQSWCPGCKARVYVQIDVRRPKREWTDETKNKIAELQKIIAE